MLIFFLDLYIESGESTRIIGSNLCIVETLPPCIGVYNEICMIGLFRDFYMVCININIITFIIIIIT